jgi:hypothetical protein
MTNVETSTPMPLRPLPLHVLSVALQQIVMLFRHYGLLKIHYGIHCKVPNRFAPSIYVSDHSRTLCLFVVVNVSMSSITPNSNGFSIGGRERRTSISVKILAQRDCWSLYAHFAALLQTAMPLLDYALLTTHCGLTSERLIEVCPRIGAIFFPWAGEFFGAIHISEHLETAASMIALSYAALQHIWPNNTG